MNKLSEWRWVAIFQSQKNSQLTMTTSRGRNIALLALTPLLILFLAAAIFRYYELNKAHQGSSEGISQKKATDFGTTTEEWQVANDNQRSFRNLSPGLQLERSTSEPVNPDNSNADDFIAELRHLGNVLDGEELVRAQHDLVRIASETLRFMEAARFLEYVYDHCGEAVRQRALKVGLWSVGHVSSDLDRETVVKWAMSLEHPDFRLAALRQAGRVLNHDDQIEPLLSQLEPEAATALLYGYGVSRVVNGGSQGIEEYMRLKPEGSDHRDLGNLVRLLSRESDILATDQLIPDDSRHIAREVRGELLRRWTRDDPQAAAAHVIANQDRIALGQLDVIVGEWALRERREAEEWIRSQADEAVRSQAAHGMASHLVQRQAPDRAWEWALEIVDPDMRARKLREVHAAWITQDYDAAENARLSLDE